MKVMSIFAFCLSDFNNSQLSNVTDLDFFSEEMQSVYEILAPRYENRKVIEHLSSMSHMIWDIYIYIYIYIYIFIYKYIQYMVICLWLWFLKYNN